ncbi:MAG: hypothetical protein RIR97_910 [Pseudomonadota bacterium]
MKQIDRKPPIRPIFSAIIISVIMSANIVSWVQSRAAILAHGTEIRLKTQPVDPRDLFRGDYVTLSYDISTIPVSRLVGKQPPEGQLNRIFVRLAAGPDGLWTIREASLEKLPAKPGTVVMQSTNEKRYTSGDSMIRFVNYGIERYYVPEGQGKAIEETVNSDDLAIIVKVSDDGIGQIARIELKGVALYEEPLY